MFGAYLQKDDLTRLERKKLWDLVMVFLIEKWTLDMAELDECPGLSLLAKTAGNYVVG